MLVTSQIRAEAPPHDPHINVTLPGGRIMFSAGAVHGGCVIDISNSDQYVNLGEISRQQFSGVGSDARAVAFSIQLDECTSHIFDNVTVGFTGTMNEQDLQVLAVTPGPLAARGVGVALFDADNTLLPINTLPQHPRRLNKGVNTLSFFAKYRLTQQDVSPGVADALVNFTLFYQ